MTDAKTKVETDIVNNVKQYLQHAVLGSRQRYGGVNVCGHRRSERQDDVESAAIGAAKVCGHWRSEGQVSIGAVEE